VEEEEEKTIFSRNGRKLKKNSGNEPELKKSCLLNESKRKK